MTRAQAAVIVALGVLVTAWLYGQKSSTDLLDWDEIDQLSTRSYEWVMHSNPVGGASSQVSQTWLYNTKTGKVYRVFERCGPAGDDQGRNGCLSALPVWTGDRIADYAPFPGGVTSGFEQ